MFQKVDYLLQFLFFLICTCYVREGCLAGVGLCFQGSLAEGGILPAAAALLHQEVEYADTEQHCEYHRHY